MLKEVLQQIRVAAPRIHVLGEFISDQWYLGRLSRAAQEDPQVLVFISDEEFGQEGGAAGVWHNLETILGSTDGVQVSYVAAVYRAGYSSKHRFWSTKDDRLVFRHDVDIQDIINDIHLLPGDPKNIVISDYGKGMFDWKSLRSLADRYPDHRFVFSPHVTTCRKAKGEDLRFLERENWTMVVNGDESWALGWSPVTHKALPLRYVITGGWGSIFFNDPRTSLYNDPALTKFWGGTPAWIPVEKIDVPHTIAIGDVFLAGFSAAWFSGAGFRCGDAVISPLKTSIMFAVECCKSALTTWKEGSHAISAAALGED